jgi:hypothetical protein
MTDPNRLRTNGSGRRANSVCRTNRSTGNFQRNRARFWQRASDYDQSAPGRNVHRSGKFQRFLAILVPTTDENRDCQAEPRPLTLFFFGGVSTQLLPVQNKDKPIRVPQIGGQTSDYPEEGQNPTKPRSHYGNYRRYPLSTKFGIHQLRLLKSETFFP